MEIFNWYAKEDADQQPSVEDARFYFDVLLIFCYY